MPNRAAANPRILLPLAAVAAVIFSAIAIYVAAGYTPAPQSRDVPAAPAGVTSAPTSPPQAPRVPR